jgi:TPR repeat protein
MRVAALIVVLLGLSFSPAAAAPFLADAEVDAGLQRAPFEAEFREMRSDAEAGDVAAQLRLGRMYERALGTDQDIAAAFTWYRRAAEAGNAMAAVRVWMLLRHRDLPPDLKEPAGPWLARAIATDDRLRYLTHVEDYTSSDRAIQSRAVEALDEALKTVSIPFLKFSVELSRAKPGQTRSSIEVHDALHAAALELDAERHGSDKWGAMAMWVALSRQTGPIGPEIAARVLDTFARAAEAGDVQAACNAALFATDSTAAHEWYLKAALRGAARASYRLGRMYRDGLGRPADPGVAARWFYRAAVQDYPPAQAALGDMFLNGFGVTPNAQLARAWLRPAAAYGNPLGLYDLGLIYDLGMGVDPDPDRAVPLIARAAAGHSYYSTSFGPAKTWVETLDPRRREAAKRIVNEPAPHITVDTADVDCLGRDVLGFR